MPAKGDIISWLFIGVYILKLSEQQVMNMSQTHICYLLEKYNFVKLCGQPINNLNKQNKKMKSSIDDVIPF
ncbi:MAG: hypothetical protein ACK5L6_10470 [Anaerorhabdus sp.]